MGERKKKPAAAASSPPPWDCGSPLYDAFELASVYRVLDSHLMALPFARRRPTPRDADDLAVVAAAAAGSSSSSSSGRRTTTAAASRAGRRIRRAAAKRRAGVKAVLHSICRSVTCSRKL